MLLPIAIVFGLFLVTQGVPQTIDLPVASQEVIKLLGTNGGGFFNVNSAHPFENPTWLSNFVEMLLILAIPAALTATYGRMVGNRRQGWTIFGAMMALFLVAVVVVYVAETGPTPAMDAAGVTGINMEGKEERFGAASTALFVVVTTAASCGAVNGAMEALSGIGGLVPMGADADRRGDLRRRRLGPLRHADVRDPRGLPVRPDGRPHAGAARGRRSRRARSS